MAKLPEKNRPIASEHANKLLAAARGGSHAALGQLLNAYRPFLLAVAIDKFDSELKAKAGPSDLVQETFIDAQRDFPAFKSGTEAELRIWLHALLLNNLADLRKRYLGTAKRQVRRERPIAISESKEFMQLLLARDEHSPSRQAMSREDVSLVEQALSRLPAAYRQVIVMRTQDRQSFAQIGGAIGKSDDAARMLWNRAMLRLKRELGASDGRAK